MNTAAELTRLRYNAQSAQLEVTSRYAARRGEIKGNYLKALADIENQYKSERALLSAVIKTLYDEIPPEGDKERKQRMEELKKQRSKLALDLEQQCRQLKYEYKASKASLNQAEREELSEITQRYENERIAIFQRDIEERRSR